MPNHRKYPKIDPAVLHDLYWNKWMPITEMERVLGIPYRSVLSQMMIHKISRRMHTQRRVCKIDGCNEPCKKVEHKLCRSGSYGTMCEFHRRKHYVELSKLYQRRLKQIDPAKYKWWQEKYSNDERLEPWRHIQKAKRALKSLRRCVADLEAGRLPLRESAQGTTSPL